MPTYEYKCNNCGHRFEKFHSILAAPIKKCPECGKNAVERLISAGAGLIFKGSGFYITDYRDSAYKDQAKAESGNGSSDAKKDADAAPASGESKPAAAEGKSPAPDSKAAPAADPSPPRNPKTSRRQRRPRLRRKPTPNQSPSPGIDASVRDASARSPLYSLAHGYKGTIHLGFGVHRRRQHAQGVAAADYCRRGTPPDSSEPAGYDRALGPCPAHRAGQRAPA